MTSSGNLTSQQKKFQSKHCYEQSQRKQKCQYVKMCDFSVFFFSLMRENGLLKYLLNILEQVLYSLCNKTQAIKIFYIQTRSDRTLYQETKF